VGSASENGCFGHLDQPRDLQVLCGTLAAVGWVVDPTGTARTIELEVDDKPIRATITAQPRPDVQAALREKVNIEHVFGFRATADSSGLPAGVHRLTCLVRRAGPLPPSRHARSRWFDVRSAKDQNRSSPADSCGGKGWRSALSTPPCPCPARAACGTWTGTAPTS
jgi:hypothetical protein